MRLVKADSLGRNFFSVDDRLKNEDYELSATYSLEEAKRFSKFDLFYLGKSFSGYKMSPERIDYDHRPKKPFFPEEGPARKAPLEVANVLYVKFDAQGNHQGEVSIGMGPAKGSAETAEYIKAFNLLDLKQTAISINGSAGTVIEGYEVVNSESKDVTKAYVSYLILNKGNSTLLIWALDDSNPKLGYSKDMELRVAENLIKIN